MQIKSIYRGAHISAFKCREVTREIQGKPVSAALDILTFTPRKAARLIEKTLKSAIANAENNNNLRADKLVVQEAVVGEGPTLKRFQPKARGSAGPIRKRTSHIRIILTDEIEIKPTRAAKRSAARKKSTGKAPARKKATSQAKAVESPAASEATGAETTTSTQE
jgi:large subunit ribosomal protein L22